MSWISNLFAGGVNKVVDSVANGLDKLFTSDEEKLLLRNELQKEMNKLAIELESEANKFEQEVTKRWVSDNDSLFTKLTRPIGFVYIYALFGVVLMMDGNVGEFAVKDAYVPLLETLLVTYTVAYVGSRGLEKVAKGRK